MNTQMIFETLAGTYCCSIDAHLTFKSSETHLTSLLGYTPEDLKSNFQNTHSWNNCQTVLLLNYFFKFSTKMDTISGY